MRRITTVTVICLAVLSLLFMLAAPGAQAGGAAVERSRQSDIYKVRTLDGVELALKRYRPDRWSPLRLRGQPVILMPGMLSNHNYYDLHAMEGRNYAVKLPQRLADWARNDPYVKADPLKYYSLAYYLWDQGYDVWLADYRGEGREPVRSGGADGYTIDELGIYDMPAIVSKVREVTGKKPVWIGHSMGSTMAYIYLQGCRFEVEDNPDTRVISDPALVRMRNDGCGKQALKGFVDLDGPIVPPGSVPQEMQALAWWALYVPFYLDMRPFADSLGWMVSSPTLAFETLLRMVWESLDCPDLGWLNSLLSINSRNLDPGVSAYIIQNAVDGVSTRVMAHFSDAGTCGRFREDWRNRPLGCFLVCPPPPGEGDGYYYYSDNLGKISLPSLVVADATLDITDPADIERFYRGKTRNRRDRFMLVPDTAHVDLAVGLNAPTSLFPAIGAWLASL